MLRRLLTLLGLAAGAAAALLAYRRGIGGGARRARIDVHFDDGSFVTYGPRSAETQRLLPLAREAASAVRP